MNKKERVLLDAIREKASEMKEYFEAHNRKLREYDQELDRLYKRVRQLSAEVDIAAIDAQNDANCDDDSHPVLQSYRVLSSMYQLLETLMITLCEYNCPPEPGEDGSETPGGLGSDS